MPIQPHEKLKEFIDNMHIHAPEMQAKTLKKCGFDDTGHTDDPKKAHIVLLSYAQNNGISLAKKSAFKCALKELSGIITSRTALERKTKLEEKNSNQWRDRILSRHSIG